MATDRPLRLEAADLGPIAQACVDLRPLTVFVGPSNTGKSWLATVAYALHRHFALRPRGWRIQVPPGLGSETPDPPEGTSTELVRIAQRPTASTSESATTTAQGITLTPVLGAAIERHIEQRGAALGKEIERCIGVEAGSHLVRREGTGRVRVLLQHELEGASKPAVHELTFGGARWTFQSTIPDGLRIPDDPALRDHLLLLERRPKSERTLWVKDAIGGLAHSVLPSRNPAFYLPADRTGLMNAHSTIVSALIQSATMAGIRQAEPLPLLSGVRGDFLEELVEMVSRQRRRVPPWREGLRKLGMRMEEEILGGAVNVGGLPGVAHPHFSYHPTGWKDGIPLSNASSMVSEIAPIVLYLRHVVAPGDLLIIDEPESHLHPAMQVAFTRRIADIAAAGVRVIVTTHSEWVLEELGNVVGRAGLTDEGQEASGVVPLDSGDVGVWLFQPGTEAGGATVKEIALDDETGLYPSGFDAVATALHNDWAGIADARGDAE